MHRIKEIQKNNLVSQNVIPEWYNNCNIVNSYNIINIYNNYNINFKTNNDA